MWKYFNLGTYHPILYIMTRPAPRPNPDPRLRQDEANVVNEATHSSYRIWMDHFIH